MNKKKIINDPVYGFIRIPSDLIYDIIQEPAFQRLRRIRQLGLTDLVYPGALHTRFHHALGAMHLMKQALDQLRKKGHFIYDAEEEAALLAILLHDVGHGPLSHTLEFGILKGIPHEDLSVMIMEALNKKYNGALSLAIQMFKGQYHRNFFNELISSQLDMDRLDYLKRDSFFTGVSEGTIGTDRIIQMINVVDDHLLVEEKGIYSIENFLSARRLMYWQVYLHKTTISAEKMLLNIFDRAKELIKVKPLNCPASIYPFLEKEITIEDFNNDPALLEHFLFLDDQDVWTCLKDWSTNEDIVLSKLCTQILNRELFKIQILNEKPNKELLKEYRKEVQNQLNVSKQESKYFCGTGQVMNSAYISTGKLINILKKSGEIVPLTEAADLPNIKAMSKIVKKYYIYWPKEIRLN